MAFAQRHSPLVEAQSKRQPADLHLSGLPLPRFHPANFPSNPPSSSSSSSMASPTSSLNTPSAPSLSPRLSVGPYSRLDSRALNINLNLNHRDALSFLQAGPYTPRHSTSFRLSRPTSPRLDPLGSPGPVTPLELEVENDGGYLFSTGISSDKPLSQEAKGQLVDSYIHKETLGRAGETVRQTLSPRGSYIGKRGDITRHRSNLSR